MAAGARKKKTQTGKTQKKKSRKTTDRAQAVPRKSTGNLPPNQEVYLVTGAASGIGRQLALTFARRGAHVVMTDVDQKGLNATAAVARQKSYSFDAQRLDVRHAKDWDRLVAGIYKKYGRLDILFNVAGFIRPGFCHETTAAEVDQHFDINAKGVIFGCQAVAPYMVEAGKGHIINFASLAGVAPIPGIALYSASKHAVRGYSLAIAQELKPRGIDVTVVCPDAVQTPMLDLQIEHDAAALTFSGDRFLSVDEIETIILEKVLTKRPPEVLIPGFRGFLSKLGAAFPGIASMLGESLTRKGRKKQEQLRT